MKYFNYLTGFKMISKNFENLFKNKARKPEKDILTDFHMDVAKSLQDVIEIIILKICDYISKKKLSKNLCLAGGVALNCVANSKILKSKLFESMWIQPASGDAGGAIGAALLFWHKELKNKKEIFSIGKDRMNGSYLGPMYSNNEIKEDLDNLNAKYKYFNDSELIKVSAHKLTNGNVIGWFQGKMEFGPRSLGCRSILADPRNSEMQKKLNLKIKFRESFRPFAPSITIESLTKWFDINCESPYMLLTSDILSKHKLPINKSDEKLFGNKKTKCFKIKYTSCNTC